MRKKNQKFIGVFDSGFGGLNILREIVKELPQYNYMYYGDSARAPYGSRSKELIYQFTKEAVEFMFSKNCELVILACNTASSDALRKIQQEYLIQNHLNKRVLGVLIPSAEEAVVKTKNKKVGVIATEGTVASEAFVREIHKLNSDIKIFQKGCPLLVPIVEYGESNTKISQMALEKYLQPLIQKKIDTLILGCTHYGVFEKQIKKIVGKKVAIISGEKIIPKKVKQYLVKHSNLEKKLGREGIIHFYSSDLTERFAQMGSDFFGRKIEVEKK
ncbi:MAG: hypothetical protein RLZZ517_680 [Candidatus Parcubacteria bacterium]|jgi:glutamate racemase